jgi:hypothetical protein
MGLPSVWRIVVAYATSSRGMMAAMEPTSVS